MKVAALTDGTVASLRKVRDKLEPKAERTVQKEFNKQKSRAVELLYENYGKSLHVYGRKIAAEDIYDADAYAREMAEAMEVIYLNALDQNNDLIAEQLGIDFRLDDPATREYLKDAGIKIPDISRTTRNALRRELTAGQELGEGVDELAARIKNLPAFGKARARMVARTELGHASNTSALALYQESGLVDSIRVYDGETHPLCAEVNGKILTLQEAKSFPTLGHPNCVRAFGAIPSVAAEKPKPTYPPEFESVLTHLNNPNSDRDALCRALSDKYGKNVNALLFNDANADARKTYGTFQFGPRNITMETRFSDALIKIQKTGKVETDEEFDAIKTFIHENIHSQSPMSANWNNWNTNTKRDKSGGWRLLEEGITETKARELTLELLEAGDMVSGGARKRFTGRGTYPKEVDMIDSLLAKSSQKDIDKIWEGDTPNKRRGAASRAIKEYVINRFRVLYRDDFDNEADFNRAMSISVDPAIQEVGNSLYGMAFHDFADTVWQNKTLEGAATRLKVAKGYF